MIPDKFEYIRPTNLDEALSLLTKHGEDAKLLAGGQSLIPIMKLRLARPRVLIDIANLKELRAVSDDNGRLKIGSMTTHFEIESSDLIAEKCPLLNEVAPHIGDVQVRNRGTIGGSLVHADPGADWPAAILALEAELEIASPNGRRTVKANDFFLDMLQSDIKPTEILTTIRVHKTSSSVGYLKFAQKASGFAVVGVAAVIEKTKNAVRLGITGVAAKPYRPTAVEESLQGKSLDKETISKAATKAATDIKPLNDLQASSEFRIHLASVLTRRVLEKANVS